MKQTGLIEACRVVTIILVVLISLNALAAGYGFITDPSGSGLKISTDYLRKTAPFDDFLIPGLILFIALGLFGALVAMLAVKRHKNFALLVVLYGSLLITWIVIQLTMVISFHPLHAVIGGSGLVLMVCGWMIDRFSGSTQGQ